jgi:lipoic acid synthetase
MKKPEWLNKKVDLKACRRVKELLREFNLRTVCEESLCPNISECFGGGVATFMILGNICTRGCRFCSVTKGNPYPVDRNEPVRIRNAVKKLELTYVVITSPTRDDLEDGGAYGFCETVWQIKELKPVPKVEILIPDFSGNEYAIKKAVHSDADVISHNLETVPALYNNVRCGADYKRSLRVLETIKKESPNISTKSGIMLGLGESREEVISVFKDLRSLDCDFLTLGQYLPPSVKHYPFKKYVSPQEFCYFKEVALELGFRKVKSSPYIRSSFLAHTLLIT